MKKKIFIYLLLLLPMFTFQSCLKDQEDLFDKDAALRLQDAMEQADKAFASSEYGWLFEYYPEENQSYGGYALTVKFADGKATVGSELDPGNFEESLYKMTNDNGPVLTFDTYNSLMHFFSTPSADNYEAFHGDFEFVVDSVGEDVIKVHGKRWGSEVYFRKLTESAESYLDKVKAVSDNFIVTGLKGNVGEQVIVGTVDLDNRRIDVMNADSTNKQSEAFTFTDKGIRFYAPFEVNGEQLSELAYDAATNVFTGVTSVGTAVTLQGTLPADYAPYDLFAGDYTLYYWPAKDEDGKVSYATADVTLTPNADGTGYVLSGLNNNFTLNLTYNRSKGCLELNSQVIGQIDGNNVWLCAWGIGAGGNLTWATQAGMVTVWNQDKEHPQFGFDTNSYVGLVTDSYILWMIDAGGNSQGACTNAAWLVNGDCRLPYLTRLVKK